MRRRNRRSRSGGTSFSRTRRRPGVRKTPARPKTTVHPRQSNIRAAVARARRDVLSRDRGEQRLHVQRRDRRNKLQTRSLYTRPRLSHALLPTRARNEVASSRKTEGICRRANATRRAVVIAKGYGGVNGRRDYKPRRKCK